MIFFYCDVKKESSEEKKQLKMQKNIKLQPNIVERIKLYSKNKMRTEMNHHPIWRLRKQNKVFV